MAFMLLVWQLANICGRLAIECGLGWVVGVSQGLQSEQAQGVPLRDLVTCQGLQDTQDTLMRRVGSLLRIYGFLVGLDQLMQTLMAHRASRFPDRRIDNSVGVGPVVTLRLPAHA